MELNPGTALHGFTITSHDDLPEIEGESIVGVHAASGARLLYLKNDDNNKSFAIGFRTPPKDDTGVFHILEHSVLCGSRRFPVKEPFVDLLRGSMQTFLNAMTFADKTLYPVASTNEQDLFNLMDVYLDAVFHPRIYEKRQIFEQEGWHYELHANSPAERDEGRGGNQAPAASELSADETTLVYNGVVYNEMKGALSDATSVLYDEVQAALFPGTCYAFESGGTPQAIPTLTYEEYLDEHRRHYRTDNSYIILYGNLDIDRALAFLDECYLTPVAQEQRTFDEARAARGEEPLTPREIDMSSCLTTQAYVTMPQLSDRCGGSKDDCLTVAVPEGMKLPSSSLAASTIPLVSKTMDTAPENACAACGYMIGDSSDRMRAMATEILLDALFGSNEAPLKRALLDDGIAHDVTAFVSDALACPFAMVQIQVPAEGAPQRLAAAIAEKARKLVDAGLSKGLIEAALSHAEFHMREHDLGMADGVVYAMMSLSSWLYDEDSPVEYLRYEQAFAQLRANLSGDYFEQLCIELLCENDHTVAVEIVPTPGRSDDDSTERLAALNASLTQEERARIVDEVALLRQLQEVPDTPEAIATLPRLSISDIGDAPDEPRYDLDWKTPITCVRHSVPTRGIAYAYWYFDVNRLEFDDLPYLSILALMLGKLDTAEHTAAELDVLEQGKLGNLSFFNETFEHRSDPAAIMPKFVISASALSENVEWMAKLPREIMLSTDFSNAEKILDVLKQRKIGMEQHFANAGHSSAIVRAMSYYSQAGIVADRIANVDFYRFLCDLIDRYAESAEALATRLADVAERLFCDNGCTISFAGTDEDYDRFWLSKPGCNRKGAAGKLLQVPQPTVRNEAFAVPADVCFAAMGWDRRLLDVEYSGAWNVASRALSFDYLWNEVRVKGGAYGVGFSNSRAGNMRFYSYRDPHLDETLARFDQASEWIARFEPSQEDLEGFIVASVAGIDAPKKPRELIRRQMGEYFTLRRPDERREFRDQVIATDAQAIRALAEPIARMAESHAICAFGNREILEASNSGLSVIPLVG